MDIVYLYRIIFYIKLSKSYLQNGAKLSDLPISRAWGNKKHVLHSIYISKILHVMN